MANDADRAGREAKRRRVLRKAAGRPAHNKLILLAVLIGAIAVLVIWLVLS
jgi:hypothetical protein